MPETIEGIVGTMGGDVIDYIRQVAPTDANVLITGETGTGKELVARAIHRYSQRSENPFVAINCSAIPTTLVESEMFGHIPGSFTGANRDRIGFLGMAERGTVFLDEIGSMDVDLQPKLLRALEERAFYRVGSTQLTPFDVRIISATCHNPKGGTGNGTFNDALFYRIDGFEIKIPPLRERPQDIKPLTYHFLGLHLNNYRRALGAANVSDIYAESPTVDIGGKPATVEPRFLEILQSYSFPGNVRELKNCVGRAVILMGNDLVIRADALPDDVLPGTPEARLLNGRRAIRSLMEYCGKVSYQKLQFLLLDQALLESDGSRTVAAKLLGCSVRSIHNARKEYIGWLTESHLPVPPYLFPSNGRWRPKEKV